MPTCATSKGPWTQPYVEWPYLSMELTISLGSLRSRNAFRDGKDSLATFSNCILPAGGMIACSVLSLLTTTFVVLSNTAEANLLLSYGARDREGANRVEKINGVSGNLRRDGRRESEGAQFHGSWVDESKESLYPS